MIIDAMAYRLVDCAALWNLLRLACGMLLCAACAIAPAADTPGEIEVPAWFKNSFLDLRDDLR